MALVAEETEISAPCFKGCEPTGDSRLLSTTKKRADAVRQFCQGFQVGHFAQGVGRRFQKQQFGVGFDGGFPFVHIGRRHMAHFDTEFGDDVIDKANGRTEQAAAGNHMIARLQEGEKRRLNRGHTGRSGDRAFRAF